MKQRFRLRARFAMVIPVLALLLLASASPGWAIMEKEILQAVRSGVPNSGAPADPVVMGELFARDN